MAFAPEVGRKQDAAGNKINIIAENSPDQGNDRCNADTADQISVIIGEQPFADAAAYIFRAFGLDIQYGYVIFFILFQLVQIYLGV